ncbi:uncharacterized protein LOC123548613 [Mercenaria mercenaria]|uniref:uncharacterized protein LOC123548613 n=1 Tax=Mercenaria mercenaria TaxID=6596 RepID=UPI00234EFDA9|nr:uncharacterized protein LOC123548613 [Mercenaria mercenaria]
MRRPVIQLCNKLSKNHSKSGFESSFVCILTVLVTKCTFIEGSFEGSYYIPPGTYQRNNADGCPPGTIYCFQTERCVNLDGSCVAAPTCDAGELFCIETGQCVRPDGRCIDDDPKECSDPNKCDEERHECGPNHLYCFETQECVTVDGHCIDNPGKCSHGEDCHEERLECGPNELFCIETGKCVRPDGRCIDDDPKECSYPETCDEDRHECGPNQLYCFEAQECVTVDGHCTDNPGKCSHGEHCHEERRECGSNELFCIETGKCVRPDGRCIDDDPNECSYPEKCNEDRHECGPNQLYCFETQECVTVDGYCTDNPGKCSHGEDCHEERRECGPNELFCIETGKCLRPDGRCIDDDPNECSHPEKCDEDRHECGPNQLYCFETQECVTVDGHCIDNPGKCSHGGDCHEERRECGPNELFCIETGKCVRPDGRCIDDDPNECSHPEKCDEDRHECGPNQLYCFETQECVTVDGHCIDNPGKCSHGEDCHEERRECGPNELFCIETGKCVRPDGRCIDDGPKECSYPEKCDEDRHECGHNQLYCFETQECVTVDGYCIDNPGKCSHGEDCHEERRECGPNELFCIETGKCVRSDGRCIDDDPKECSYPKKCDEDRQECGPNQLYCFETQECVTVDGHCIDNPGKCSHGENCHEERRECGPNELFCIETGKCVRPDGICIDDDPKECSNPKKCEEERHECGPDQLFCIETGQCVRPDGRCTDDDTEECSNPKKCDDDRQECGPNQLFCIETGQCVRQDGGCTSGKCSNPDEDLCDDGHGGFTCKPVGECNGTRTVLTADVSLTLEGNFSVIVRNRKEEAIQELQANLPTDTGIDSDRLIVTDVLSGSIIVIFEVRYTTLEEFKRYVTILETFVTDKKAVTIFEISLPVIAFDVDKEDSDDKDDRDGDDSDICPAGQEISKYELFSSLVCPAKICVFNVMILANAAKDNVMKQIFCPEKNMCVSKDYDLAACEPEITECNETQEFCLDEHGYGTCVREGECKIKSIKLRMLTDADYGQVIKNEAAVVADLELQIAEILVIDKDTIKEVTLFQGSLGVLVILYSRDPADLASIIDTFEQNVMQSQVKLLILGQSYTVRPDSFKVTVDLVVLVPECSTTGTCIECSDQETQTQCYNLGTELGVCVPKRVCRLESACPVPETDSVSTCVFECDPTKDKKNSDGKLCCPIACGGGVYVDPLEYYVCPKDEDTGVCLTDAETQCESGMDWCPFSFTCTTTEQCEKLALQHNVDEITQSDLFMIRFPMMADNGKGFNTIFKPTVSGSSLKEKVSKFADVMKQKLQETLSSVTVESVGAYPEGTETATFTIYARISVESESVTADDIYEKIKTFDIPSQPSIGLVRAPGDPPSVTAMLGNANKQIFIVPEPIAANIDSEFDLFSIIPDTFFTSTPVNAILDCSEKQGVQVVAGDGVGAAIDITSAQKFGIRHTLTDVALVKCQLTSDKFKNIPEGAAVFIGFVAVPKPVGKLSTVTDLDLTVDHIETVEDSGCIALPENLFTLKVEGDDLYEMLYNWPAKMTGLGEVWRGDVINGIQSLLLNYHMLRERVINNIRATVATTTDTSDNFRVAKLIYKDEPLKETAAIDILSSINDLKICIKEDYSGTFHLEVRSTTTEGRKVQVPIKVKPTNDAPELIRRNLRDFSYPAVPPSTSTEDIVIPEFRVGMLTSVLAVDTDSSEELGIALIGAAVARTKTAVVGDWTISQDGGTTWEDVTSIETESSEEITHTLTHLDPNALLRFIPSENDKMRTWTKQEAPMVAFLIWDLSNRNDITTSQSGLLTDLMTFKRCYSLESGMSQYCNADTNTAYTRNLVVLQLPREGCDGVPDSGKVQLRCGCGDDSTCLDCNNIAHGDAKRDACNVCGGTNEEFDCNVNECKDLKPHYCEQKEKNRETVNLICDEGEKLRWDLRKTCEDVCIPIGENVTDRCGVPCGKNECIDCGGEIGKNEINTCGYCRPIATSSSDVCESKTIGIRNIQPPLSNARTDMNVTVSVVGLAQSGAEIEECQLEPKNPEGIQAPSVVLAYFNPGNDAAAPTIVLTIQASEEDSPPTGEFAVRCKINGNSVSTADDTQADGHKFLLRYDNPKLLSVTPATSRITDLTDISITGSGFLDTGVIMCLVPCSDISDIENLCDFKEVEGKRISDTEVTCPANRQIVRKRGHTISIFVILEPMSDIDLTRLPQSNSVTLTVYMPAPTVVSAVLDRNGCKMLTVTFDMRVIGVSDEACSNYFEPNVFADTEAKCMLNAGSRKMFIEYSTPIAEGDVLTFKPNVIHSAAEHNTDAGIVQYVDGSVTVIPDEQEEKGKPVVVIDPKIPDKVGCSPVTLQPMIRNKGCWDVQVSWAVTTDDGDETDASELHNAIDQHTSFTIKESEFKVGVVYTFNMSWTTGKHSGSDSKRLTKDPDESATVKIVGIKEEYEFSESIKLNAKFSRCENDVTNVAISWTLAPLELSIAQQFRTVIQGKSLTPKTTYQLSYKVTYGSDEISGSVSFKIRAVPIEARIAYKDDISERKISHDEDKNITLSCVNNVRSSDDDNNYDCTWTCKTNLFSKFAYEKKPCPVYSETEERYIPLELNGKSITLLASERIQRQDQDLREEWCVSMSRGEQESTSCRTISFTKNPKKILNPEIQSDLNDRLYISEADKIVEISAKCRKGTRYSWATNDDEEEEEEEEALALQLEQYLEKGHLERNIEYRENRYVFCGIKLNLENADLIPGQNYRLKLTMYNMQDDYYLASYQKYIIAYIPTPQPGIVQAVHEEEPIIALTTKIRVSMFNWYDVETCDIYYITAGNQNGRRTKLNTLPLDDPDEEMIISLPEGEFSIGAECCNNARRCASATADGTLTVQPTNSTGFVTVIERDLTMLTLMDSDQILSYVGAIFDMMTRVVLGEAEAERTGTIIKQAVKKGIRRALEMSSDKRSKLAAMEKTVEVIKSPDDLDEESKGNLHVEARDVAKEATGSADDSKRKKRSTTVYSKPTGLTESEAITLLKVFDSTLSKEGSIKKEDATNFSATIDYVMLGMCQNFTGSTPWVAPADLSYIRVQRTSLAGYASMQSVVSCDTCQEVEYPAKVNYGSYLETFFNDTWTCTPVYHCTDVCVATAQLNIDIVTLTASKEIVAPTRKSDIIILKMINPETYAVEQISGLTSPIQATLTLNGTIDMEKYDYKCMMWVSEDWSDQPCNISTPTVDPTSSQYTAVCSCDALGIISIFQELKPEEIATTSTSPSPTTSTSMPSNTSDDSTTSKTDTNPTDTSTTAPSKTIRSSTDYVNVEFKFSDDYASSVGSSSETAFNTKIKQDLVARTGYSPNNIKNLQTKSGSIIVTFELHAAGSGQTLGQMLYKIENMITTGSIPFTTPSGTPLNMQPGSFSYEEIDDDDDDDGDNESESSNLPFIIGGALGGLVIICITVIVILLILKNKKQRTHPTRHDTDEPAPRYTTPPPTYAIAQPPPPYTYTDPPPQVNKWVEDELNGKKTPPDQKRPPSNGSNRSGTSFEKNLTNKARAEPTPVGE